jgi:putative Holliday junction resolvase
LNKLSYSFIALHERKAYLKRKMGLDVGDKTIGIALSDPLGITAQGLMTYRRIGRKKDMAFITELVKNHECDTVVIGLPINLKGEDSVQTEKVRLFRTHLENKLRSSSLASVKIEWQDERFTTSIAEDILIKADVSREDRKKVIDKQAAVLILQSWLDGR